MDGGGAGPGGRLASSAVCCRADADENQREEKDLRGSTHHIYRNALRFGVFLFICPSSMIFFSNHDVTCACVQQYSSTRGRCDKSERKQQWTGICCFFRVFFLVGCCVMETRGVLFGIWKILCERLV